MICPGFAIYLSGSQSVWPNRFLSIYTFRLKGGGGCSCVRERVQPLLLSNVPERSPGAPGGAKAWR